MYVYPCKLNVNSESWLQLPALRLPHGESRLGANFGRLRCEAAQPIQLLGPPAISVAATALLKRCTPNHRPYIGFYPLHPDCREQHGSKTSDSSGIGHWHDGSFVKLHHTKVIRQIHTLYIVLSVILVVLTSDIYDTTVGTNNLHQDNIMPEEHFIRVRSTVSFSLQWTF